MCTFIRDIAHFIFLCILEDTAQRFGNLETRTGQVEDQVHSLEGSFNVSMISFLVSFTKRSQQIRGLNKLKTMRTVLIGSPPQKTLTQDAIVRIAATN